MDMRTHYTGHAVAIALALLLAACGDDGGNPEVDVDAAETIESCPAIGAILQAAPVVVEFGEVGVGFTKHRELMINSGGTGQLCFSPLPSTVDNPMFMVGQLMFEGLPTTTLDPGQRGTLDIAITPSVDGPGQGTLTVLSINGGSQTVSLSYTATPAVAPGGSLTVNYASQYIYDGVQLDADPSTTDANPQGITEFQALSGTFDSAPIPEAAAIRSRVLTKHYPAEGTIVIEQRSFDASSNLVGPYVVVTLPDTTQVGGLVLDIEHIDTAAVGQLLVMRAAADGSSPCVAAMGSGNLGISQATGLSESEGGSILVSAPQVQLYAPALTPIGDLTGAVTAAGYAACP